MSSVVSLLRCSTAFALVAFAVGSGAVPARSQQFEPAVSYATHAIVPEAVAVGDFNNDGRLDLAVQCDRILDIFFALQNGTFGKRVQTPTDGFEQAIAVADLNGDGNADVVTANQYQAGEVNVLLGNGDGTFQPFVVYPTNTRYAVGVAVADLNGDRVPDIVAVNRGKDGSASVFLGNGDGKFQPEVNYPVGGSARSLVVTDLNNDGIADLAITAGAAVRVLIGVGDGTFLPHVDYPAGFGAYGIGAADLNHDGKVDLVVIAGNALNILPGNGDGTFGSKKSTPIGTNAMALAIVDFNHDGILDVAATQCDATCVQGRGPGNVELLLGKGNGSFQSPSLYPVGLIPDSLVAADFNRDGFPDVATSNYFSGDASVLLNTGQ
jgi:hypothetical protein